MRGQGAGCGVPGATGSVENMGPEVCGEHGACPVFVISAHDQRSHHCQLMCFPKVSKCQARLLVINNRIYNETRE